MKVKMLKLSASTQGIRKIGSIQELPDKEAKDLIAAGAAVAVQVKGAPAPETKADVESAEKADAKPEAETAAANSNKGGK